MKKIIPASAITVIFMLILLAGCKSAPPPAQPTTGCLRGNCYNGDGLFVWGDGSRYDGSWVNGKKHGKGVLRYSDGNVYTGEFIDDSRNGEGVNIFNNGDKYEGNFWRNVPDGKGIYTYADGTVESGEFSLYLYAGIINLPVGSDNSKVPIGRVANINIATKEIEVAVVQARGQKVLKMGQKVFIEVNGVMAAMEVTFPMMTMARCRMIGQTQNLISEVRRDMQVYEMVAGIKRGNDTFLFPNGNKYVGSYRGKLMNGKGEFIWTNGNRYTGEFRNGLRHGKGTLNYYHGGVYSGDWKSGKQDGKGFFSWPAGDKYEGDFKGGWKNGKGIYTWKDGGRYEGEFKNDKFNGKGTEYDSNGSVVNSGNWENDKFIGE